MKSFSVSSHHSSGSRHHRRFSPRGFIFCPFFGLVDIEQIALIGHSRGGEAVALAAAFNRLSHYPDNANIRWAFNFDIQSVVAIAPVDQQYRPAGHPNQLTDVNYLVLQGGHDADVSKFDGYRQYQRAVISDPESNKFKAGDDAKKAVRKPIESLFEMKLAFDHNKIVSDYLKIIKRKKKTSRKRTTGKRSQRTSKR